MFIGNYEKGSFIWTAHFLRRISTHVQGQHVENSLAQRLSSRGWSGLWTMEPLTWTRKDHGCSHYLMTNILCLWNERWTLWNFSTSKVQHIRYFHSTNYCSLLKPRLLIGRTKKLLTTQSSGYKSFQWNFLPIFVQPKFYCFDLGICTLSKVVN